MLRALRTCRIWGDQRALYTVPGLLCNRIQRRKMLSFGAIWQVAVAAPKSSSRMERQLCFSCAPAVVERGTWWVINISRVCLRAQQSFGFSRCSYVQTRLLVPVCAHVCSRFVSLNALSRWSFPFMGCKTTQLCFSFKPAMIHRSSYCHTSLLCSSLLQVLFLFFKNTSQHPDSCLLWEF